MLRTTHYGKTFALADLKSLAEQVERTFLEAGINIHADSALGRIIRAASSVGTDAAKPVDISIDARTYHDAHSLARLAQTVLSLDGRLASKKRLRCLYEGDLNFWSSTRSPAKDTEWECMVAAILSAGNLQVHFTEPPDLCFSGTGRSIGVACKKIYSLKNSRKQISKGVEQIVRSGMPGILALSLDHFVSNEKDSHSFVHDGNLTAAKLLAAKILSDFAEHTKINRIIERRKLLGAFLFAHFYVQDRARPHLFMAVSATRITHRGTSHESKLVMDRVDECLTAWMNKVIGPDPESI